MTPPSFWHVFKKEYAHKHAKKWGGVLKRLIPTRLFMTMNYCVKY